MAVRQWDPATGTYIRISVLPPPKKLSDLDPQFIRYETRIETWDIIVGDADTWHERGEPTEPKTGPREYMIHVDTLDEAQGIFFQCPKCAQPNGLGHCCQVTFADRGVLEHQGCHNDKGEPTRWAVDGTGFNDLTTKPSVLLQGGCNWHGYITRGLVSII